jgi:hypothetical protein
MAMGKSAAKVPAPATMMATPHRGAPGRGGGLRDMRGKLRDEHGFQSVLLRHRRAHDLQ